MIVELDANKLHVSVQKGFLFVDTQAEKNKIPLDDIECLIINSFSTTITSATFHRFYQYNIPVLICGTNSMPCSLVLPYGLNVYRKERINLQINSSQPLKKNIWQQIVKVKISNQASVLALMGHDFKDISGLSTKVLSGDKANTEAHAARIYWQRLFGKKFRRDANLAGLNSFLNYGYSIIRAVVCRNIVASGLIPELGLHHHNQMNPYCLADDIMEPYRPIVDLLVANMAISELEELSSQHKKKLASLSELPLSFEGKHILLKNCVVLSIQSYLDSMQVKKASVLFPCLDENLLRLMLSADLNEI